MILLLSRAKGTSQFGPADLAWGLLSEGFKLKPIVRDLRSTNFNVLLKRMDTSHSLANVSSKAVILGQYLIRNGRCWSSVSQNQQ